MQPIIANTSDWNESSLSAWTHRSLSQYHSRPLNSSKKLWWFGATILFLDIYQSIQSKFIKTNEPWHFLITEDKWICEMYQVFARSGVEAKKRLDEDIRQSRQCSTAPIMECGMKCDLEWWVCLRRCKDREELVGWLVMVSRRRRRCWNGGEWSGLRPIISQGEDVVGCDMHYTADGDETMQEKELNNKWRRWWVSIA